MSISEIVTIITSVMISLGGLEFIKWFLTRKANKRSTNAQADQEEIKAEQDEFHYLRERVEFVDKQLMEKEKRFNEQTVLLREIVCCLKRLLN